MSEDQRDEDRQRQAMGQDLSKALRHVERRIARFLRRMKISLRSILRNRVPIRLRRSLARRELRPRLKIVTRWALCCSQSLKALRNFIATPHTIILKICVIKS